jgi:hypothetical protein
MKDKKTSIQFLKLEIYKLNINQFWKDLNKCKIYVRNIKEKFIGMRKIGKLTRKIIRINYKKWQSSLISWIFDIKKNRDKSKVWRKSQFIKLRKKGKIINIPNSLLTDYKANSIISAIVEYWEARVREAAVDQPQNQVTILQQCVQRAQLIEQQPRIQ